MISLRDWYCNLYKVSEISPLACVAVAVAWPPTTLLSIFSLASESERHRETLNVMQLLPKMGNTLRESFREPSFQCLIRTFHRVSKALSLELARSNNEAQIQNKDLIPNLPRLSFGCCLIHQPAVRLRIGFNKSALGRNTV